MVVGKGQVFHPKISVTLYKTVDRWTAGGYLVASQRFIGSSRSIDLTPWLGDGSSVTTSKGIRAPAGGFTLILNDRMIQTDMDSVYGMMEPMDLIVIRMARNPHEAASTTADGELPIVMRGFVSSVTRAEIMGRDGKPNRSVVVAGQDYGKLWQIYQIFYASIYPINPDLLNLWQFFTKYGVEAQNMPAPQFVSEIVTKILNPYIEGIRGKSNLGPNSPLIPVDALSTDLTAAAGNISPFGLTTDQWGGGSLYSLLQMFCDVGPWNELYIDDRQTSVNVVYRANPMFELDGTQIQPGPMPTFVDISSEEVEEISLTRSDQDVANFYWTEAPRSLSIFGPAQKLYSNQDPETIYLTQYPNCDPGIYGLRKMDTSTHQGNPLYKVMGNGVSEAELTTGYQYLSDWLTKRRLQVMNQNKDNIVLEHGTISIRGREDIKAGMYVNLTRGTMTSSYYVVSVSHQFIPFQGFTTTLGVERGTAFVNRILREGGKESPYLSELATP